MVQGKPIVESKELLKMFESSARESISTKPGPYTDLLEQIKNIPLRID